MISALGFMENINKLSKTNYNPILKLIQKNYIEIENLYKNVFASPSMLGKTVHEKKIERKSLGRMLAFVQKSENQKLKKKAKNLQTKRANTLNLMESSPVNLEIKKKGFNFENYKICSFCKENINQEDEISGTCSLFNQTNIFYYALKNTMRIAINSEISIEKDKKNELLEKYMEDQEKKPKLTVTACGHLMHYSCYLKKFAETKKKTNEEFNCPICKKISNFLLFYIKSEMKHNFEIANELTIIQFKNLEEFFIEKERINTKIDSKTMIAEIEDSDSDKEIPEKKSEANYQRHMSLMITRKSEKELGQNDFLNEIIERSKLNYKNFEIETAQKMLLDFEYLFQMFGIANENILEEIEQCFVNRILCLEITDGLSYFIDNDRGTLRKLYQTGQMIDNFSKQETRLKRLESKKKYLDNIINLIEKGKCLENYEENNNIKKLLFENSIEELYVNAAVISAFYFFNVNSENSENSFNDLNSWIRYLFNNFLNAKICKIFILKEKDFKDYENLLLDPEIIKQCLSFVWKLCAVLLLVFEFNNEAIIQIVNKLDYFFDPILEMKAFLEITNLDKNFLISNFNSHFVVISLWFEEYNKNFNSRFNVALLKSKIDLQIDFIELEYNFANISIPNFNTCLICSNSDFFFEKAICLICGKIFCIEKCINLEKEQVNTIGNLSNHAKIEHASNTIFMSTANSRIYYVSHNKNSIGNSLYLTEISSYSPEENKLFNPKNATLDSQAFAHCKDVLSKNLIAENIAKRKIETGKIFKLNKL